MIIWLLTEVLKIHLQPRELKIRIMKR